MFNIKIFSGAMCLINRVMATRERRNVGRDLSVNELPCFPMDRNFKNSKDQQKYADYKFQTAYNLFDRYGSYIEIVLLSKTDKVGDDITLGNILDLILYLLRDTAAGKPRRKPPARRSTTPVVPLSEEEVRAFMSTRTKMLDSLKSLSETHGIYGAKKRISGRDSADDRADSKHTQRVLESDPAGDPDKNIYNPNTWVMVQMEYDECDPENAAAAADPGPSSSSSTGPIPSFHPSTPGDDEMLPHDKPGSPDAESELSWGDSASVATDRDVAELNFADVPWGAEDFHSLPPTPRSPHKQTRRLASTPLTRLDEALRD